MTPVVVQMPPNIRVALALFSSASANGPALFGEIGEQGTQIHFAPHRHVGENDFDVLENVPISQVCADRRTGSLPKFTPQLLADVLTLLAQYRFLLVEGGCHRGM